MVATIREVVDDALELVGEMAGASVSQYSEDAMFRHCVRAFNMMFKRYPWSQYIKFYRLELDGTLGIVSTDSFEAVRDLEDFIGIYRDGETRPISRLPAGINPYAIPDGTTVRYWSGLHTSDSNFRKRRLQFYPVSSVGFVNVSARPYPLALEATNWDWDDTMYLDRDLLVYAAAFNAMTNDGLNADAANSARVMMDVRFNDITSELAKFQIPIDAPWHVPTQWSVAP